MMSVQEPAATRTRRVYMFVGLLLGAAALFGVIQQAGNGAPTAVIVLRSGLVAACAALALLAWFGRERLGMIVLVVGVAVLAPLEMVLP